MIQHQGCKQKGTEEVFTGQVTGDKAKGKQKKRQKVKSITVGGGAKGKAASKQGRWGKRGGKKIDRTPMGHASRRGV